MAGLSLSLNPFQMIQDQYNADRAYDTARSQNARQEVWNQLSHELDTKKYLFSKQQFYEGNLRQDNQIQRMVNDANKAGVSLSTALGAAPSAPVSVSIPGHGTRRVGTASARAPSMQGAPEFTIDMQQQQSEQNNNITNRTKAEADLAFFKMLNEKHKWEQNRANALHGDVPDQLPNRYELYTDNTKEAINHHRSGGYVMPTGAQWELPQTMGGYEFSRPYWKQNGNPAYNAEDYYYNNGLGIAP